MSTKARVLFLSHGGGPMPLLGDEAHQEMVDCLLQIRPKLPTPSAILLISAHWEESYPTVTTAESPELIYDYYGFPEESYSFTYPAKGQPQLAESVYTSLKDAGIEARKDEARGFDHGLFVPLTIMYPDADIPCVQLSLVKNMSPEDHLKIGEALQELDFDNLLIIGSGFSFHNVKEFFAAKTAQAKSQNEAFEGWLLATCRSSGIDESIRRQRLVGWEQAPAARYCHPREEHLLPLHVCYGVAQTPCMEAFELTVLNKKVSMYLW